VSRHDARERALVMGLAIAVEGGLAVIALVLGRLLGTKPLETLSFEPVAALVGVAATAPLVLGFFALLRWPAGPAARIRRFSLEVLCPALAPCTVPDLAAIALLAGVGEEMLFRGTLQAWFAAKAGPVVGLVAASVLFGLLHAVTPAYAVLAALIGAYLGLLWQATGNILTPVVVHALYDFVALWYLLAGPGRSLWEKQGTADGSPQAADRDAAPSGGEGDYFAAPGAAIRYDWPGWLRGNFFSRPGCRPQRFR
jgi:membrane protease YdiL (CAAX protease family)